jgi:hypothetical protein
MSRNETPFLKSGTLLSQLFLVFKVSLNFSGNPKKTHRDFQTSELTPTDVLDDVKPIVLDPDTDEDEAFYPLSDSLRRNSWRLSIPCPGNVWRINYRRDRS